MRSRPVRRVACNGWTRAWSKRHDDPDNLLSRQRTPHPAVTRDRAIVPEDEVVVLRDSLARDRCAGRCALRQVRLTLTLAVHVDRVSLRPEELASDGDDALDEIADVGCALGLRAPRRTKERRWLELGVAESHSRSRPRRLGTADATQPRDTPVTRASPPRSAFDDSFQLLTSSSSDPPILSALTASAPLRNRAALVSSSSSATGSALRPRKGLK